MSTHNIRFRGEIKKIINTLGLKTASYQELCICVRKRNSLEGIVYHWLTKALLLNTCNRARENSSIPVFQPNFTCPDLLQFQMEMIKMVQKCLFISENST